MVELRPDRRRTLVGPGRVTLVDDSAAVQRMQIDVGPIGPDGQSRGIRDNTIRAAEFGLASNPPIGTDVVVLAIDGDLSNAVIIATNHQGSRPTGLNPGEVLLYDLTGNRILLSAAGITLTPAAGKPLTINAPDGTTITGPVTIDGAVAIAGNVAVTGAITATGSITADV